jgi:hypothetical protein
MTTEYLALWVHFLWSGLFTLVFSVFAWWQFGLSTGTLRGRHSLAQAKTEGARKATRQRRQLLYIAVMISACLLIMMGALLSTSSKLEEWSRTADVSLACAIKETPFARNWESYGFKEGSIVEACSAEISNAIQIAQRPCWGDCFWHTTASKSISSNGLVCSVIDETLEEIGNSPLGYTIGKIARCDCPCSSLIQVERPRFDMCIIFSVRRAFLPLTPSSPPPPTRTPTSSCKRPLQSVAALTLAHVAQSLVVAIAGLILGFRFERYFTSLPSYMNAKTFLILHTLFAHFVAHALCNPREGNLNIWKKLFRKKKRVGYQARKRARSSRKMRLTYYK